MRSDALSARSVEADAWLESQCRAIESAGKQLAEVVDAINERLDLERSGSTGRSTRLNDTQLRQAEAACEALHAALVSVQDQLFDCEHELRELRERDVSPAELLIEGDRLIRQYRFLRRRARILDGLLAFLPVVNAHAAGCLDALRLLQGGALVDTPLISPDCGFALVALDQLEEETLRVPQNGKIA
jgi:hypothetical protein